MKKSNGITITVIDDEPASLNSLGEVLTKEGYQVQLYADAEQALPGLADQVPDLVITDLRMPGMDGMQVLHEIKKRFKDLPVVVMTAFTTMETAIAAIKQGAYDYLSKPFQLEQLRLVVKRALEQSRLLRENQRLRSLAKGQTASGSVVGRSPEMVEIYKLVAKVAPLKTTVLIQGETGTGKEVIARLIHNNSNCTGPFLAVNCGALTESLLESELFGYVKGAFTGALAAKAGLFESAQGGTCFLDEISNTSLNLQMKLLRVLEEGEIMRVGSSRTTRVNARVIASANRPLEELVDKGRFREDLMFRLKVITLDLPLLRERKGDIPLLIDHFVGLHASENGRAIAVDRAVYTVLSNLDWPGNVRELSNVVERAVALNTSGILTLEDFSESLDAKKPKDSEGEAGRYRPAGRLRKLAEMESEYIQYVLESVQGNVTRAAEILDIDRRTIYRILNRANARPGPAAEAE